MKRAACRDWSGPLWNTEGMDIDQPLANVDADLLERARAAAVGYPELEDVLQRLDAMDELDVEDLPAEFDAIHRLLRAALGDVPS